VINYVRWIGLPHGLGADPDDGIAADCAIIAVKILTAQGFDAPPVDALWFNLAAQGRWLPLFRIWRQYLEPWDAPGLGCLQLHYKPGGPLGMGVFVDGGFLTVSHSRGVIWRPVASKTGTLWRLRSAAV
jgi:hypothetical protein